MRQIGRLLLVWAGAVAGHEYCSPFTARYLTYLQREQALVFHHGQGYIARPADGCQAKHGDRHAVSYIKPFRAETWLNDTLSADSAGLPSASLNNYAIAETPSGFIAIGGGVKGAKTHFGKDSYILLMHKPTWAARWSMPRPIIGTEHPGCIDVRLSRCEYDGKLSVADVNASHFRVYARANMKTHGGRHVVTALCSHHACGPFALIQVEDYVLRSHNSR